MDIDIKNDRFENVGYDQREQIANEVYNDLKKMKLPNSFFLGSYLETSASTITAFMIFAWAAFSNEVWIAKNLALLFIICGPIIDFIVRPYIRKIYGVTPYQIIRKYAFLKDGKKKNISMKGADVFYTENELSVWKFYSFCLILPVIFFAFNYLIFLIIPNIELHTGFNDYYHYLLVIMWVSCVIMRIFEDVYGCYYHPKKQEKELLKIYNFKTQFPIDEDRKIYKELKKNDLNDFSVNWLLPRQYSIFAILLKLLKKTFVFILTIILIVGIFGVINHLAMLHPERGAMFLPDSYEILFRDLRYDMAYVASIGLIEAVFKLFVLREDYIIQKIFIRLQKLYLEEN